MPPVAADFQKYKITVQIMTKQEILEREDAQSTTIHLYKKASFGRRMNIPPIGSSSAS